MAQPEVAGLNPLFVSPIMLTSTYLTFTFAKIKELAEDVPYLDDNALANHGFAQYFTHHYE